MSSASSTNLSTNGIVSHGLSGGTLVLLLVTGLFSRDAFETQLQATDHAIEAIEDLRGEMVGLRTEVGALKERVQATEALGVALGDAEKRIVDNDERLDELEVEVGRLRACVRDRKRCAED